MFGWRYFFVMLRDRSIRADNERLPLRDGHSHHACLHAVSCCDFALDVCQQWERQSVVLGKGLMRFDIVEADTKNLRIEVFSARPGSQ